jgi:cystathionine beta-lyase
MGDGNGEAPGWLGESTLCVHEGTHADSATGGVNSPIFTSSAYAFPHPSGENTYPRYFNTPNHRAVARKAAALERAEAGLILSSGMAAISTALFAHLRPGDHAVFQSDLYGGTRRLLAMELTRYGVGTAFGRTPAELEAAIRPETRIIYLESPSNPLLRCLDLAAVAAIARSRGIATVVDNTFATPINQNPIALGIDIVVHSATKYLNGHSDLSAGVIVAGREAIGRMAGHAINLGGVLDAHACYQLERGMKTLALRVERQNGNAMALARFLEGHPAVERVHYPGLPGHPDHGIASRQMRGFGGMLAFDLRDAGRVDAVLGRFRIAKPALSLGGVETLVCVPARTSHASLSPEERREAGIGDGLLRVSAGIEDLDDLFADFETALEAGA